MQPNSRVMVVVKRGEVYWGEVGFSFSAKYMASSSWEQTILVFLSSFAGYATLQILSMETEQTQTTSKSGPCKPCMYFVLHYFLLAVLGDASARIFWNSTIEYDRPFLESWVPKWLHGAELTINQKTLNIVMKI